MTWQDFTHFWIHEVDYLLPYQARLIRQRSYKRQEQAEVAFLSAALIDGATPYHKRPRFDISLIDRRQLLGGWLSAASLLEMDFNAPTFIFRRAS